jgi:hypothetical protein
MKRYIKRTMVVIALSFAALCILFIVSVQFVTIASPRDETNTTMTVLVRRILIYAAENGRPPARLEDLAPLENNLNLLVDGWHRQIEYRLIDDNTVELISRGEDGLPDGKAQAQDMSIRFTLRDEQGHWKDPLDEMGRFNPAPHLSE